jgi:hypothetical protein
MKLGKRALFTVGFSLIIVGISIADVVPTADSGKFFDPEHQRPVSSRHADSVARLIGTSGDFKIELTKAGGRPRTIALPDDVAQVNSIAWASENRIAVIGMINGSGYTVAVIDAAQATIMDTFFGYQMTLSPNRDFAIFIKYFQPHGVDDPEDRIRMYDFLRPAKQNRPTEPSFPPDFEGGIPVYPVLSANEEAARSNIGRPDTDAYHAASQFKWSEDSTRVLFVMLHGEHELTLVSATPDGRVAVVDLSPKCAPHCDSVLANNIEFIDGGIGLDVLGIGNTVGRNKHVVVGEKEFSAVERR